MLDKICIIGHPSPYGGADTELDHQIHAWQALGLKVYILHTGGIDSTLKNMKMEERGCIYKTPRRWNECQDMVVISYCNGEFLRNIREIRKYAKKILWVNCMTWLFGKEKQAHQQGMIDYFIYQTDHAREKVQDELIKLNSKFNYCKVKPYFYADAFPFHKDRPNDKFRFGRVSRADADKFAKSQMWIYETMTAPVLKEGMILGWNSRIEAKVGKPPDYIKVYDAGKIPALDVYKHSECYISANDTYENLPRVAFEAMSSGSLLIVDDRGGWKEQINHKETGFLCKDEREFVYYATRAAHEEKERKQMIQNARDWLISNWGLEQSKREWASLFEMVERDIK